MKMKKHEQIAKYAYENSIFYREYIVYKNLNIEYNAGMRDNSNRDNRFVFDKLPIVGKEDIVDSRLPLCPAKCLTSNDEKNVIKMLTSGSTGKSLEIQWNKEDIYKSMTELWFLRKKYYGINPSDKMCYFYTTMQLGADELLEYESKATLGFSKTSLNEKRIRIIYEKMLEYKPVWLMLQPSMADMIMDVVKKYDLKSITSVRYIEFSGEMLSEKLKKEVSEFFECSVANQYGSYEFNSIAYECPYGNMHVMSSNVYVEMINDELFDNNIKNDTQQSLNEAGLEKEQEGELIITSLTNKRNPFIRYKIGDRGILIQNFDCKCGNHNPVIKLTVGRSHNYVHCEDGTKLNAYIFPRAVDNINYMLDNVIKQFQVIQRAVNDFKVRMYIDDRSQISAIKEIFEKNILDESLKNAKFEYSFEQEYIKDKYGDKLMYFRREE